MYSDFPNRDAILQIKRSEASLDGAGAPIRGRQKSGCEERSYAAGLTYWRLRSLRKATRLWRQHPRLCRQGSQSLRVERKLEQSKCRFRSKSKSPEPWRPLLRIFAMTATATYSYSYSVPLP